MEMSLLSLARKKPIQRKYQVWLAPMFISWYIYIYNNHGAGDCRGPQFLVSGCIRCCHALCELRSSELPILDWLSRRLTIATDGNSRKTSGPVFDAPSILNMALAPSETCSHMEQQFWAKHARIAQVIHSAGGEMFLRWQETWRQGTYTRSYTIRSLLSTLNPVTMLVIGDRIIPSFEAGTLHNMLVLKRMKRMMKPLKWFPWCSIWKGWKIPLLQNIPKLYTHHFQLIRYDQISFGSVHMAHQKTRALSQCITRLCFPL